MAQSSQRSGDRIGQNDSSGRLWRRPETLGAKGALKWKDGTNGNLPCPTVVPTADHNLLALDYDGRICLCTHITTFPLT